MMLLDLKPDQIDVFERLADLLLKLLFGLVGLCAFTVVVILFVIDPSWPKAWFGTVLSPSAFRIYRHYFGKNPMRLPFSRREPEQAG